MNLSKYTFVALDLEATGLDTKNDTIIEVAAVRFHLIREGNIFRAIDIEERSMLVNPGRMLEENISMITGISDKMLEGKPKWRDISDRVREFIGDSIIVGHNVLFDTAMLAAHGIDLDTQAVLDTFELSEIFSQDAESLNLGFLGKKYQIPMEGEHRALDDTKLSIGLFCQYLSEISLLTGKNLELWGYMSTKDESNTLSTLLEIVGITGKNDSFSLGLSSEKTPPQQSDSHQKNKKKEWKYTIISLSGNTEEEKNIINASLSETGNLLMLTPNKKQAEYYTKTLKKQGYKTGIYRDIGNFCSISMLSYWLNMHSWKRKESIFIIKLTSWILSTKTGLLDELKYYGDERTLIELFRATSDEVNPFFRIYEESLQKVDIIISDIYASKLENVPLIKKDHALIVRDAMWIEDGIRRKKSIHISFEELLNLSESLSYIGTPDIWESFITGFSIISDIYRSVPERPKGENSFPPGDFGETYFMTQGDLWHRGEKWLILGTKKIEDGINALQNIIPSNPVEKRYFTKLIEQSILLVDMSQKSQKNISIIISILPDNTKISLIPRDVRKDIHDVFITQNGKKNILLGYGIHNEESQRFLEEECDIENKNMNIGIKHSPIEITKQLEIYGTKSIVLTTSTKHVRMLVKELKGKNGIKNIWAQGVSGGKGKMMSLFKNTEEKSVLIGIIDSWIDESELWENVDEVIIMKIPFDPPTDPYFLARTVGMKNNFEEYSTPIALTTINTLIGRIRTSNSHARISCADERINTMNWGKEIKTKIL